MIFAISLCADCKEYDIEHSLSELCSLADSADIEIVAHFTQNRDKPDGSTYVGEGKLQEAAQFAKNCGATMAIVNDELTGTQIQNLGDALELEIVDRTMLILRIFALRAVGSEGKLQVELANLQYRLPRLKGLRQNLSRQGGGGAGGGGARRGAGETQLEFDRRHIQNRILLLKEKLKQVDKRRGETRKRREKNAVPVVALVGYTNVGKSSLLNRICGSDVLAEDKLFATLDPVARSATLSSGLSIIFIDTVGFISRLPHNLISAFKSTLSEAKYADLLLLVADAGSEDMFEEIEITKNILIEIGCNDIKQINVYNKCDIGEIVTADTAICVSAVTGFGIDKLLSKIDDELSHLFCKIKVLLPYDKGQLQNIFHEYGQIESCEYTKDGTCITATLDVHKKHLFDHYIIAN